MTKKTRFMKDMSKFWAKKDKARKAFDTKRSSSSFAEKLRIVEKLHADQKLLKKAKIVSPKP